MASNILICLILTSFIALFSFIPKLSFTHWAIRGFDFIKIQLTVIQFIALIFTSIYIKETLWFVIPFTILLWAIYSNIKRILPFTSWQLKEVRGGVPNLNSYSIFTANVYQDNKYKDAFINKIKEIKPDVFVTLETNLEWEKALTSLEKEYPFSIKHALPNYYGIHLYSKKPIQSSEIQFVFKDSIPSIYCIIQLDHNLLELFCVHPEPPSPTENTYSDDRDAELLRIAYQIKNIESNVMVVGDMNDVAWSRTTNLFKKLSGLKDPRVGRAFYSTFSANLPKFLRFPVDHIFCSSNILCQSIKTIPIKGSDHLGMYFRFSIVHSYPSTEKIEPITQEENKEILHKMNPTK